MTGSRAAHSGPEYREWRHTQVSVAGTSYTLVSKPGVFAHGTEDPAAVLLAERVKIAEGDVVVHLNCRNGLFGTVAARVAARVVLTDRNIVAVGAAKRTLAANGVTLGEVLLGHGTFPLPPDTQADVVAIRIPQEKLSLLQLLTDAFRILKVGGRCYLAGANNEGAKTAAGMAERMFGNGGVLAVQSGHRVVMATKQREAIPGDASLASPYLEPGTFNDFQATLRGRSYALSTRPGVFSWDHLDEATTILADTMEINAGESVLDLGCGGGALGVVAGALSGQGRICMVDADVEAVRSATRTAELGGLINFSALTSDIAGEVLDQRFEAVVTNPPFHVGKATDLTVPAQFIRDAYDVLAPNGRLYLVANRTLPYERQIFQLFDNIATMHDGRRFKVLSATKGTR
ncbi:MAG: methyltransferase [bacterium]